MDGAHPTHDDPEKDEQPPYTNQVKEGPSLLAFFIFLLFSRQNKHSQNYSIHKIFT